MNENLKKCYEAINEQKEFFEESLKEKKDENYETIAKSEIIALEFALNVIKTYMRG